MTKVEILTDTTVEGLQNQITQWTSGGWRLHEGIIITAWKSVERKAPQGEPMISAKACGFLQVLTRTEGTCRSTHVPSGSS